MHAPAFLQGEWYAIASRWSGPSPAGGFSLLAFPGWLKEGGLFMTLNNIRSDKEGDWCPTGSPAGRGFAAISGALWRWTGTDRAEIIPAVL